MKILLISFLIDKTFDHTQNSVQEDNNFYTVKENKEYVPLIEEKYLLIMMTFNY